jgi:hypothetical protein
MRDSWTFGRYSSQARPTRVTTATMVLKRPALISHNSLNSRS